MPVITAFNFFKLASVQWEGEGQITDRRRKEKHFRAFSLLDEIYEIGDFILISRTENISESTDKKDCYVAQIVDLFEKELIYHRSETKKFAQVQWFWQAEEIGGKLKRLLKGQELLEKEVVLDMSKDFEHEVDLDSVIGKCKVLHIFDDQKSPLCVNKDDSSETFIVKKSYDGKTVTPLSRDAVLSKFQRKKIDTPMNNGKRRLSGRKNLLTPNGNLYLSETNKTSTTPDNLRSEMKSSLKLLIKPISNDNSPFQSPPSKKKTDGKQNVLSPISKMQRLKKNNVVDMILNDSDEDESMIDDTNEDGSDNLDMNGNISPIKYTKRRLADDDDDVEMADNPNVKRRRLSGAEKRQNLQNTSPNKACSPDISVPSTTETASTPPRLLPSGLSADRYKYLISSPGVSPSSGNALKSNSISSSPLSIKVNPSLKRLVGSPARRRSCFEAPECEKIVKTPEASRRDSDKSPESLECGRRRLSVNLFCCLKDQQKSESPNLKQGRNLTPSRNNVPKHIKNIPEDDCAIFTEIKDQKDFVSIQSDPVRRGSRKIKTPHRFIGVSPDIYAKRSPTPKASRTNLFKHSLTPKSTSTREISNERSRTTPRRNASLKIKSYAEMSQDYEGNNLKVTLVKEASKPGQSRRYGIRKSFQFDSDDSDADQDFKIKQQPSSSESEDGSSDEFEDDYLKNTRKSLKASVKKSVRSPHTPKRSVKAESCHKTATPIIPSRLGTKPSPQNALEEARARLHVSAVPDSLPCREKEFSDIFGFVEGKILDGTGGCMYISGVPGTGKTATVKEAMKTLEEERDSGNLDDFSFIEINGMRLTEPRQAYVEILKALTGKKATADHAANLLSKQFSNPGPRSKAVVILVDELDLLWTRKQDVLYNIFDWPTLVKAKLIVLAVANTMDLPERMMMKRVASRLGLTRMTFQPYTFRQLEEIVSTRLSGLNIFDADAIQLAARKVAAVSGDARRALDICRRSTEISEARSKEGEKIFVNMIDINTAVEEMFCSPKVVAIRNLSMQEQLFLRAIVAEFQRTGIEEAEFSKLYDQHLTLCRFEGFHAPTMTELFAICNRLGSIRLLLTESGHLDLRMRVRLNISQDDIMYALSIEEPHSD